MYFIFDKNFYLVPNLLSSDVQSFIRQHELDDTNDLILKANSVHGVPMTAIAEQIIGRRKTREKLPTFYHASDIVYPPPVNLEQCSSEQTASYKSTIALKSLHQKVLCADLTGGFGVDSFFLNKVFNEVHYIEPDIDLLEIAQHNHLQLGAKQIKYHNTPAEKFLMSGKQFFDCIYIDPSRRASGNKKVFSFSDCEPDVTQLQHKIFKKTNYFLIKASPLLDIQQGLTDLISVKCVFVLAVENECKELAFLCENNFTGEPTVEAVNLLKNGAFNLFAFRRSEEHEARATFSEPFTYLYEPNAAVLKAGAFKVISTQFNVNKLHPSTHLYTSDTLVENFPGKIFRIVAHVKADSKSLREYFPKGQANLTTRNYPLTVKELRSRTGLKEGGNKFLIGFSGTNKKFLVVAEKLR